MKSHSKASSLGTPWLTKKHKDITAKHQDGMMQVYVMHLFVTFSWIHAFLFYNSREKKDGVGGWGLTGTPIDMSSFYLPSEFFFSFELRRPSGTTLHHGISPLANENV